jgi:hypothetical protein
MTGAMFVISAVFAGLMLGAVISAIAIGARS